LKAPRRFQRKDGLVPAEAQEVDSESQVAGESRWPMAGAVAAAMVLTFLLPNRVRPGPNWLLPLIEGLLLVALIMGDPGEINLRSSRLRGLSIALVSVLVLGPTAPRSRSRRRPNTALWSPALDDVSCASDDRRGLTS